MDTVYVRPQGALFGTVTVGGCKNAALPILAAVLLCRGPCVIDNLPAIRDVTLMLRILSEMGVEVRATGPTTYFLDPRNAALPTSPSALTGRLRASAYLLGAGLGRFGEGRIGRIGGCDFGERPIDQHLKALGALGADVCFSEEEVCAVAPALRGAEISFDTVSVGATVNAMLAAVCAEGETVLRHAACEPHIVDLASFLNRAGAEVRGAGTPTVRIRGVPRLRGCRYAVVPDMIEAGTYLLAAAATRGRVTVRGIPPEQLGSLISLLSEMGARVRTGADGVAIAADGPLAPATVTTAPYPGFPTDLHPQTAALLCTVKGESRIHEQIWDRRFRYIDELCKMGARASVCGRTAILVGGPLHGARLRVPDLRAGAALLIAALAAEGESCLEDAFWIERGYESLLQKFSALGADVREGGQR